MKIFKILRVTYLGNRLIKMNIYLLRASENCVRRVLTGTQWVHIDCVLCLSIFINTVINKVIKYEN